MIRATVSREESAPSDALPTEIVVAGRRLQPTPVFDTYWRFAAQRQAVYQARLAGRAGPWTDDIVISAHRFTNCYRAADRVSQFLISDVIYSDGYAAEDVVLRVLLFKMFNRVSTWQTLLDSLGDISWRNWNLDRYDDVLSNAFARQERLYSAAYVIPPPRLGAVRKHTNHLRLLDFMMHDGIATSLRRAPSLRAAFEVLRGFPSLGEFLAFQFAIDLNYSAVLDFSEMDDVVAGPGARDGIRKCFGPAAMGIETEVIRYVADSQNEHFLRLGLEFEGLRGRPLQLVDCQNLFCEVDKYARAKHPDIVGVSGRTRIKQRFTPVSEPVTAWFPPKWGLNECVDDPAIGPRRR